MGRTGRMLEFLSPLDGAWSFERANPRLTPWATFFRPSAPATDGDVTTPESFRGQTCKLKRESQTKAGGGGVFDFLHGGFEHGHKGGKDGAEIVDTFVDLVDEPVGADVDQLAVPLQEFLADGFLVGGREGAA